MSLRWEIIAQRAKLEEGGTLTLYEIFILRGGRETVDPSGGMYC